MKRLKKIDQILLALGSVIRERRNELLLSQEELAQKSNLHRTYISDLERGKRNITLGVLYALCQALELTVPEILEKAEQQPC